MTYAEWQLIHWIYKKWCDGYDRSDIDGNKK